MPTDRHLLLGVSGSVAAYRAADLAREMMRRGWTVRVCLTDAAGKFVTPALFEALTGQPCLQGVFEEPETGRMAHIDWARWAHLVAVVPATANTLAKLSMGIADDMLSTLVSASTCPLAVAPAMNPTMYASEAVQTSLSKLRERGAFVIEPTEGDVACGENGQGKLASIDHIADELMVVASAAERWKGKRVLITSGPTREPIDAVRFLSNRSSGKMGAALARAALLGGADVTLVTGPVHTPLPQQATVVRVETAQEMLEAALRHAAEADLIIGVAAVADYRPAQPYSGKLRRGDAGMSIDLVPNPDILAALRTAAPNATVVGFAAEPDSNTETAKEKLARKGIQAIAVNDISQAGIGFDSTDNALTLIHADGHTENSGKRSKLACALWLLERVAP